MMKWLFVTSALMAGIFVGLTSAAAEENQPNTPKFVEITDHSGIDSRYTGDWEYMVGGGVATFDCNGDGFPDLLIAGGTSPAKFYQNISTKGGAIRFEAKTSGLELDKVIGAYPIDIDGDGIIDLVLLRVGEPVLMRGLGGCKFERANEIWKFETHDAWNTAFAATWEKGATWPTLALGTYINYHETIYPWGTCTDNYLYRPDSILKPVSGFQRPDLLNPGYCTLSMLFTDWKRSGTPDLRVSNDREYYQGGQEQLWHIPAGSPPALYTEEEGWKPLKIWGMGIASYDLSFDGYPDYFLTSMADNKLQVLNRPSDGTAPVPAFKDIAYPKGVTAHRPYMGDEKKPSTAWHAQFEDVNNDGYVDLFIAKGNVSQMPDFAIHDPNNLLVQSKDGQFHEMGDKAGVASVLTSRGASLADFNLDGKIDLLVVNRWDNAQIWQNVTPDAGNFVEIMLHQDGPNRDAIGAWLEVDNGNHIMRREITIGGGHASGQLGWHHFGVGPAQSVKVRTIWPDGTAGEWETLASNDFYSVSRGQAAKAWQPGTSP